MLPRFIDSASSRDTFFVSPVLSLTKTPLFCNLFSEIELRLESTYKTLQAHHMIYVKKRYFTPSFPQECGLLCLEVSNRTKLEYASINIRVVLPVEPNEILILLTLLNGITSINEFVMKASSAEQSSLRVNPHSRTLTPSFSANSRTTLRVTPDKIPVSKLGVRNSFSRTMKMLLTLPSAMRPSLVIMIASSTPALLA